MSLRDSDDAARLRELETDRAIADIKRQQGTDAEPPPAAPRTEPGDPVDVLTVVEPHITVDTLTPLQISTLLRGQAVMRRMFGEPEPTDEDAEALLERVTQILELARGVQLTFSGHILMDADREKGSFRFCRYFVPPDPNAAPSPPPSGLVDVSGAPLASGGPQLVTP